MEGECGHVLSCLVNVLLTPVSPTTDLSNRPAGAGATVGAPNISIPLVPQYWESCGVREVKAQTVAWGSTCLPVIAPVPTNTGQPVPSFLWPGYRWFGSGQLYRQRESGSSPSPGQDTPAAKFSPALSPLCRTGPSLSQCLEKRPGEGEMS